MKPIIVDLQRCIGTNTRFWQAAGSDLLFSEIERESGQVLLDRMQNNRSCRFLRNHYVLSDQRYCGRMVGGTKYHEDENGEPTPDFSRIIAVYREMVKRGIKPIVEYDFIPTPLQQKKEGRGAWDSGPAEWGKWRRVMQRFTEALVEAFGLEEMRTWRFEVWNEPDGFPLEERETFYRMYDEFAAVVKAADDQLIIGGPGCAYYSFLEGFLQHVTQGKNYVTGETGAPIDFISCHSYATVSGVQTLAPYASPHVDKILTDVWYARRTIEKYGLLHLPFQLNEWGLCAHFAQTVQNYPSLNFRNSEYSASFFARLVDGFWHMQDTLSFCPEILLYWGFSWEDGEQVMFRGNRELTTGHHIPKPIQTAHEILARLADQRIYVETSHGPAGAMATRSAHKLAVVAYVHNESDVEDAALRHIELKLAGLPKETGSLSLHITRLDRQNHNTYRLWEKMNTPDRPDEAQIAQLRQEGELSADEVLQCSIEHHEASFGFDLSGNGLCLIETEV